MQRRNSVRASDGPPSCVVSLPTILWFAVRYMAFSWCQLDILHNVARHIDLFYCRPQTMHCVWCAVSTMFPVVKHYKNDDRPMNRFVVAVCAHNNFNFFHIFYFFRLYQVSRIEFQATLYAYEDVLVRVACTLVAVIAKRV